MGDAGGELAERSELFGLHQPILRGAQIFQRKRQLLSPFLNLLEQLHIRYRDDGLVGENFDGLNLPRRERLKV